MDATACGMDAAGLRRWTMRKESLMSGARAKLTKNDLLMAMESPRYDHPARKDFTLRGKTHRGRFYPNPEGCTGIRVQHFNQRIHVPAAALVN